MCTFRQCPKILWMKTYKTEEETIDPALFPDDTNQQNHLTDYQLEDSHIHLCAMIPILLEQELF